MSRIAGLISFAQLVSEGEVYAMLGAMPAPQQARHQAGASHGRLGWAGRTDGNGGTWQINSLAIAIDGAIGNRQELGVAGDSDGARIAALYQRGGAEEVAAKLAGDYTIAIYDAERRDLCLIRDRLGIKPLYYANTSAGVAFASQPSGLFAAGIHRQPDPAFIARFCGLHYRLIDNIAAASPYLGVTQLTAGHLLQLSGDRAAEVRCYWTLNEAEEWRADEATLAEQYREMLFRSVSRRLSIARRPAFTLSGGLDSSSVVCSAAYLQGERQVATSSVYVDATYDERNEIKDVADEKISEWIQVEIPNQIDLIGIVRDVVRIHDEPVATATWLSHHILIKDIAARGFGSLFGGLGGDELNAGEYEYFPMLFADLLQAGDNTRYDHEVAAWAQHHDHPIFRKNRDTAADMISRMTDRSVPGKCRTDQNRMLRYAHAIRSDFFDFEGFAPVMDAPYRSYLKNRTFQDIVRETLPCCLRAEDRQSTAAGLDHFDPFLDHDLVEFMFRVPSHMKIRDGVTKQLLRQAMRGVLPEATRTRIKKTGWNAPAHQWFQGKALNELRDLIRSPRIRNIGFLNEVEVDRLIDEHVAIVRDGTMKENHMMFLWQLLNTIVWLDAS
jgi:asparagine synthase (glutamine-hydrolysing)